MNTATLRGLTIGEGTVYDWRNWADGILSTADIRVIDQPLPRRDGVIAGDDYRGALTVVFELQINAGSLAADEAAVTDLRAAFAPSRTDEFLDVTLTGDPTDYTLIGRPRGCVVAATRERLVANLVDARCTFVATDPIAYGPQQSVLITLVDPGEGLEFPVIFPIVFSGGGSGSGTGSAPNDGTTEVDWMATLTGPLTNPRLSLSGSGLFVDIDATIVAGQTIELDSRTGSVLLNGTAPRPSWVGPGSVWWRLEPGANTVLFTADAGTGTATVTWRPGYA